jgi:tRNA threonylcarbamoyl adenosine modification protein YeaZ
MDKMQLVIDTSTGYAGLALVKGFELVSELTWRCGSNHSVELSPRLVNLLAQNTTDVGDLDCIIVAKGPGSFNGLRVGVSEAKGMAFSLGIPILGISTLEATAYQYASSALPVCAVQNAGREEVALAVFQRKPRKGWTRLLEEQICSLKDMVGQIKESTIFCGEFDQSTADQIRRLFKSKALMPTPAAQLRRAAFIAELGQMRIHNQDYDNLAALQPLYLRRPPITERKKPY